MDLSIFDQTVKSTKTIDLGNFDEAYRGAKFQVWVSVTRAHVARWGEIVDWINEQRKVVKAGKLTDIDLERINAEWQDRKIAWYADTWLNIGQDEARQIRDALLEKNPPAWEWLTDQTVQAIREYKDRKTKN